MPTVAITGASGFVGTALQKMFQENGYKVIAIRRDVAKDIFKLTEIVEQSDIVINLAGASIIARWSESYKKELYDSRINITKNLVEAIGKALKKPALLISTSAVGIYTNNRSHSEFEYEYNNDFLGNLAKDWENTALEAKKFDVRCVIFRFGIVLGKQGGAFAKMLTPFRFGLGGKIGNGKQYFSFIHINDLCRAFKFVVENNSQQGIYNLTAPNVTTNERLTKVLATSLNRPAFFDVPEFVLKLIFGEGAKVLTDGQNVYPKKLLDNGFVFEFDNIEKTIKDLTKD